MRDVVCHLVTNQVGMDYKKGRGKEESAEVVFAAKEMFRQHDCRGRGQDPKSESDLLTERMSREQENSDWQEWNEREKNEAGFYGGEKKSRDGRRDAPCDGCFSENKRPRQKFDETKETEREKESTNRFRSNSHFRADRLAGEKKDGGENEPQQKVSPATDPRRRDKDVHALPGQEKQSASRKTEEMLDDNDSTQITEHSEHQKEESGINRVSAASMDKFTPSKLEQGG
jgi:hypothetical protein